MTLLEDDFDETAREHSISVLKTERLTLRALGPADAKAIALLANDRRIAVNTARIPHPYGVADAEQFLATTNKRDGELCLAITLDGTLIGGCGLHPRDGGPEIGYWLGVPYWGQGFATEAVRAVIKHAFADLGHDTLQSSARVSNPASRRVLEKCGFEWTCVRLCRVRALNSSVPVDCFRLDRARWVLQEPRGRLIRLA